MSESTTLAKAKVALRISNTTAFDGEIGDLIDAALADLDIAGVDGVNVAESDPLILRAIILYCKIHFGEPDRPDEYQRSYDSLKANLGMSTGYTTWTGGDTDGQIIGNNTCL